MDDILFFKLTSGNDAQLLSSTYKTSQTKTFEWMRWSNSSKFFRELLQYVWDQVLFFLPLLTFPEIWKLSTHLIIMVFQLAKIIASPPTLKWSLKSGCSLHLNYRIIVFHKRAKLCVHMKKFTPLRHNNN